jgi:hypothetical protein
VNVTRSIRSALVRIARHSPILGDHLEATIHRRLLLVHPDPRTPVTWNESCRSRPCSHHFERSLPVSVRLLCVSAGHVRPDSTKRDAHDRFIYHRPGFR